VAWVYSYGSINATISAMNAAGASDGGQIGDITAWGAIGGSITAAQQIGTVTSGGTVGATVAAPTMTSPVSNDASLLAGVIPDTPASVTGDVMAAVGTAHQAALDEQSQFAAAMAAVLGDIVTAGQQAA